MTSCNDSILNKNGSTKWMCVISNPGPVDYSRYAFQAKVAFVSFLEHKHIVSWPTKSKKAKERKAVIEERKDIFLT